MPNLNQVTLCGRLTKDAELRYLPSNTAVCSFSLAINRIWRNQQGEKQEETTFVDCETFAKTAEVLHQHTHKGSCIIVIGRLQHDVWTDKDGKSRSKLKVIAESFQFLDPRPQQQDDAPRAAATPPAQRTPMNAARAAMGKPPVATQDNQPGGEEPLPF